MSILLKRDMSSSPRKLPQARNNTTVSANNHGCVCGRGCVCVIGTGGELHWFIVNRGQQLPVSVSGRYNKRSARSDALYCSSACNLFSCWPRTLGGAACLRECAKRWGVLCTMSNICPPESSDREVSAERIRGEGKGGWWGMLADINCKSRHQRDCKLKHTSHSHSCTHAVSLMPHFQNSLLEKHEWGWADTKEMKGMGGGSNMERV